MPGLIPSSDAVSAGAARAASLLLRRRSGRTGKVCSLGGLDSPAKSKKRILKFCETKPPSASELSPQAENEAKSCHIFDDFCASDVSESPKIPASRAPLDFAGPFLDERSLNVVENKRQKFAISRQSHEVIENK